MGHIDINHPKAAIMYFCVQASIVYVSGNQQANEILISPNHVSTETKYLTDT